MTPSIITSLDHEIRGRTNFIQKLYQKGDTMDLFDLYVLFFTNSHHVMFSSEFAFMSSYIFFVNKTPTS